MQSPTNESDISNLDLLRALAVLIVYFSHLLMVLRVGDSWGFISLYQLSQAGVMIFFVHTAFVLMLSLSAKNKAARACFERSMSVGPFVFTL